MNSVDTTRLLEVFSRQTIYYAASTDTVKCPDHGWKDYFLFQNSQGALVRICSKCFSQVVPVTFETVAKDDAPSELCSNIGCANEALLQSCVWCANLYCLAHMSDESTCESCEKEVEGDKEHLRFREL